MKLILFIEVVIFTLQQYKLYQCIYSIFLVPGLGFFSVSNSNTITTRMKGEEADGGQQIQNMATVQFICNKNKLELCMKRFLKKYFSKKTRKPKAPRKPNWLRRNWLRFFPKFQKNYLSETRKQKTQEPRKPEFWHRRISKYKKKWNELTIDFMSEKLNLKLPNTGNGICVVCGVLLLLIKTTKRQWLLIK